MDAVEKVAKLLLEWGPVLIKLAAVFDDPAKALAHLDAVEAKHRADIDRRLGG